MRVDGRGSPMLSHTVDQVRLNLENGLDIGVIGWFGAFSVRWVRMGVIGDDEEIDACALPGANRLVKVVKIAGDWQT